MKNIEERIAAIEKRNRAVELDKAWETSAVRRICIAVATYIIVFCYLKYVVDNDNPYINAFVPVLGFLLSTGALRVIRRYWEKSRSSK